MLSKNVCILLKMFFFVMYFLVLDITYNIMNMTFRIWKCSITLLPGKYRITEFFFFYPLAAFRFYILQHCWDWLCWPHTYKLYECDPACCLSGASYVHSSGRSPWCICAIHLSTPFQLKQHGSLLQRQIEYGVEYMYLASNRDYETKCTGFHVV